MPNEFEIIEQTMERAEQMAELLSDFVEHIDACDEKSLLACDDDQHPPSYFSALADRARKFVQSK